MWSDSESGNCMPKHVTQELPQFLTCGILSHGFAQMHCDACHKRYLAAFSCYPQLEIMESSLIDLPCSRAPPKDSLQIVFYRRARR